MADNLYFASNLKYLRAKYNIEQLELAEKLGRKSASSISEWEKGKYTPKAGTLNDIAKIFDVTITELMNEDLSVVTSSTLSKITSLSSHLSEQRQEKVLDFATDQLVRQKAEQNSSFIINLDEKRKENELINLIERSLNAAVANNGKRLSGSEREFFGELLKEHLKNKED